MNAIISVIGKDKVGILAMVATECAAYNVYIEDVSQTIVNGMFTMTMGISIDDMKGEFTDFVDHMAAKGKANNLVIRVMHQDIFNSMHRI